MIERSIKKIRCTKRAIHSRNEYKIHLKCDRASWREPCFAHTPPPPSSDEIPFEYAVRICRHWKHGITPKIYSFQSFPFSPFPSPSPKRDITAIIIIPLLRFVKNQWEEKNNNFSRQNNDPIIPFDLFYLHFVYIYIFIPSIPLQWTTLFLLTPPKYEAPNDLPDLKPI